MLSAISNVEGNPKVQRHRRSRKYKSQNREGKTTLSETLSQLHSASHSIRRARLSRKAILSTTSKKAALVRNERLEQATTEPAESTEPEEPDSSRI